MPSLPRWLGRLGLSLGLRQTTGLRRRLQPTLEALEDRWLPSTTYLVNSLEDTLTDGTLRYAIAQANVNHTGTADDPDVIQFDTPGGTISVNSLNGPAYTIACNEVVIIDATTATGYAGTPIITLDGTLAGAGADGLTILGGGSTIKGFAIVNFSGNGIVLDCKGDNTVTANYIGLTTAGAAADNGGNGILIDGSDCNTIKGNVISANQKSGVLLTCGADFNTISGNMIGTNPAGTAALGNGLDGVTIQDSDHNVLGNSDPVTGISYYDTEEVSMPVSGWQGIRAADTAGQYLMVGTSNNNGILFVGTMEGVGTSYAVNYPGADTYNTSVYGPDNLGDGVIRLVGSYKNDDYATADVAVNGFLFVGTVDDLDNPDNYRTFNYPGAQFNYVHSTAGGLVVGNYDSLSDHGSAGLTFGPGHAFIYDIATDTYLTDVAFPGALSNTAYGIWYNGGTSYTIAGGYSLDAVDNFDHQGRPIGLAYLVDYDKATNTFSHWKSFAYPKGVDIVTHFQGISSVEKGVYTLSADSAAAGTDDPVQGSWVTVRRNTDGTFGEATWVDLAYTGLDPSTNVTSNDSVYGNQVVGIVLGSGGMFSYQATINIGFQLSNVISGNGRNGIGLSGACDNQIAMNYIGTDITGTVDLGNAVNGILVTDCSNRNLIGGEATGGNDPTNGVFVRPPQGNLISGNDANGVLITHHAKHNQLSGNFIGTDATGNAALGNGQDGVAIVNADCNSLIGCTFQQDPFVFYNVIGGNHGNGLRITDSDNTTVQANFFGLGANNLTPVGNALDGALINGSSANTQFGGVIPLGNVTAGNGKNGLEIADTASGSVVFNTFSGLPAFVVTAVGNALDGMLITSTGGNNLIRTNVVSGNLGNGIHIGGNATGVQVADVIVGLDTAGGAALPNGGNGILIDGNAHDNDIGGYQASVCPQNTISANGQNGIAIVGNAHDNTVFHSYIGTDIFGLAALGNAGAGIFVGGSAQNNTIGGSGEFADNVISGNQGGGIVLTGTSHGTQVIGNYIGTDRNGQQALANHGAGIRIVSSGNQVGGTEDGEGNVIAFNTQDGVVVDTGTGNGIFANSIFSNGGLGIHLVAGGNNNQPAPVLTGVSQPAAGMVKLTGVLSGAASTAYTLEFFATPTGTAGQGKTFLGSLDVTTNGSGVVAFEFASVLPPNVGAFFTATATDPSNNTSAFSASITEAPPPPPRPQQQTAVSQSQQSSSKHRRRWRWYWRHPRIKLLLQSQ